VTPRESPIYSKSYDLLKWLLPNTAKFPKQQRFVLARQIEEAAFGFHRAIVQSSLGPPRALVDADLHLTLLRTYLRLACDLRYYSLNQYEHAARLVDELGRLVGGWKRRIAGKITAPSAPAGRDVGEGYRPARRFLEQQHDQPADGESQQQHAGQPEQQHRVPLRE
jgi:hypothetical protein